MPFIIDGGGGTPSPSPTPTPVPAPIATSQVDVYVDNTSTGVTTRTGNIAAPFLTIQEALNKIGKPTSSADSLRLMCVHVSSGNYTETLNVPEGRMIKIVCHGWVNFTGNINYLSDGNARLGSGIRSFLSISGIDNNLATSTHIGRQGGMTINGRIIRKCTSVTGITTHDLYLSNVVVTGGIGYDSSIAQAGGTSLYLVRSRLQGTTSDQIADSGTGFPLAIQQIEDSKIEGTLKVSRLGGATRTEFASCAMTVLQAGGDIPPFGYYDCLFIGSTSLTAPAGAFKLNGVSYKNAASVPLSGGVAREYIDGESPLLATLTSNTFSGTQTAPTVHADLFLMSDNSVISYSDGYSSGGAAIKPIVGIDDLGLSSVSTGFMLENRKATSPFGVGTTNFHGLVVKNSINVNNITETKVLSDGIILQAPNGSKWKITVSNTGTLAVTAV